jgi:hypothetical protein
LYALLNNEHIATIHKGRLLDVERQHYGLALRLAELDNIGAPPDAQERQRVEADMAVAAQVIDFHQGLLGITSGDEPPRVEPARTSPDGDHERAVTPTGEKVDHD